MVASVGVTPRDRSLKRCTRSLRVSSICFARALPSRTIPAMPAPTAQAPSCAPGRSPTLPANAAALIFWPPAGRTRRTTNEVPDLMEGFVPVNLHVFLLTPPLIRRLRFILDDFGGPAGPYQLNSL